MNHLIDSQATIVDKCEGQPPDAALGLCCIVGKERCLSQRLLTLAETRFYIRQSSRGQTMMHENLLIYVYIVRASYFAFTLF